MTTGTCSKRAKQSEGETDLTREIHQKSVEF